MSLLAISAAAAAFADGVRLDLHKGEMRALAFDSQDRLRIESPSVVGSTGSFVSAVTDLGAAGTVRVDWIAQWIAPQRWKKHTNNPIFGRKQTGKWDTYCNGVSIVRNPDGRTYKMFYSGREGEGIGFAEASIADPLTWVENPASPVLKPRADNWEGNMINQPRVVKVTETHWRMYYTGWGFKGAGPCKWAMAIADSHDTGVTWKRLTGEPALPRGEPGAPDDGAVFVPEVQRIGDRWWMWYTAMKLNGDDVDIVNIHICLATSTNGIDWVKHPENPVLTDGLEKGPTRKVLSRCCVRYDHGVFQMWYSNGGKLPYRIRYAESLDGVHWERSPVRLSLDVSPKPAWDDVRVEYPTVDVADGQWRLWFCGNAHGDVGFATGIVEADVAVSLRSGPTATPDAAWADWQPVSRDTTLPAKRYVQVRTVLSTRAGDFSPTLNSVTVTRTK